MSINTYTVIKTAKKFTGVKWADLNNLKRKSDVYVPSKGPQQIVGADKSFASTKSLKALVCRNFSAQTISGFNVVLGMDYPDIIPLEATLTSIQVRVKSKSSTGSVLDALMLQIGEKPATFVPGTGPVPATYTGDTVDTNDRVWNFSTSTYNQADFNDNNFSIRYKKRKSVGILYVDAISIIFVYSISSDKFFLSRDLTQKTYENTYCDDVFSPTAYTAGKVYGAGTKSIYAYQINSPTRSVTTLKELAENEKVASMFVAKSAGTFTGLGAILYGTYFDYSLGIFRMRTDGSNYNVIKSNLNAGLHKASFDTGGYIYGTTAGPGAGNGYVWKLSIDGTYYAVDKYFESAIKSFTNLFYNTTIGLGSYIWGGANPANPSAPNGFLYQIRTDGSGYNVPKILNGTTEGENILALISGADQINGQFVSKIYGLTNKVIFSMNYNGTGFTILKTLPSGRFFKYLNYSGLFAMGKVNTITPNNTKLFAVVGSNEEIEEAYPTLFEGCGLVSVNVDGTNYTNYYNLNYFDITNLTVTNTFLTGTCSSAGEYDSGFTFSSLST